MGQLDELPAYLARYGVPFYEVPGWQTNGNGSTSRFRGVVNHHDAFRSNISATAALRVLGVTGNGSTPAPLCNVWIDDDDDATFEAGDPVAWILAGGVANHAGKGAYKGLRYNSSVVGVEARNNGLGEAWSPRMYDTYVRVDAAIADCIGCSTEMLPDHKEWTSRKIDRTGINPHQFRFDVALRREDGGAPNIPDPEDDDVTFILELDTDGRCFITDGISRINYLGASSEAPAVKAAEFVGIKRGKFPGSFWDTIRQAGYRGSDVGVKVVDGNAQWTV